MNWIIGVLITVAAVIVGILAPTITYRVSNQIDRCKGRRH